MINNKRIFLIIIFLVIVAGNIVLADDDLKIKQYSDTDKKNMVILRAGFISRAYYTGPSVTIITAGNFNNLTVGAGIGINKSGRKRFYEMIIALKAYPLSGKISPIIYSEMGYASKSSGYNTGSGPIINVGTGLRIKDKKTAHYFFELGYKSFMNKNYFVGTVAVGF